MSPRLIALSGPLEGSAFDLIGEELSIGRSESNRLPVPSAQVSRQHCVIWRQGDRFSIRDLNSKGGTFVNDVPIREHQLAHGDRVIIGDSTFLFAMEEKPEKPAWDLVEETGAPMQTTLQLRMDEALYLSPERVLAQLAPNDRIGRHLSALLRIATAINSIREPEALQQRLAASILEVVPADRVALLLVGEDGENLAPACVLDRERRSGQRAAVSRTITRHVLKERTSVLSNDVLGAEAFGGAQSIVAQQIRSALCVPLQCLGKPIGVLYLDAWSASARFDADHLELATAIAAFAGVALENARRVAWLEEEARRLQAAANLPETMIGDSPAMREVARLIGRMAATDATVLIRGETGTGKELVARAVHAGSPRAGRPFVAINCAAITETLLESELFGHEKGAFTGAIAQKKGKLEAADGGTVFLDEAGELSPAVQAKLLRVLQEREFERVGGTRTIKVDIRVVAATNKDLEHAVRDGGFRQDLYYRFNVLSLTLPPLRERQEDIPLLASYFAAKYKAKFRRDVQGLSSEARRCLQHYDWPGNVRELENAIERAVALASGEFISPEDLPDSLLEVDRPGEAPPTQYHGAVREAKKQAVLNAVAQAGGVLTEAARLLGVHPNYLHRLIKNMDLRAALKK